MKYPVAERTVTARLAAGPATAFTAFSLEPAGYSIPDPDPAAAVPVINSSIQAIHSVTTLPGCAARISLDLPEGGKIGPLKPKLAACPSPRRSLPPLDSTAATTGRALGTPPLSPPKTAGGYSPSIKQPPQQATLHTVKQREDGSTKKALRPSVDAAAGAQVLHTALAAELMQHQGASGANAAGVGPPFAFRGRTATEPPLSSNQQAQAAPAGPPVHRLSAPESGEQPGAYEWAFGESLQHARIIARYAAMDAADEVRYERLDGRDSLSDDGDGGKARGAWKLLASLLGSNKVQKLGAVNMAQGPRQGPSQGSGPVAGRSARRRSTCGPDEQGDDDLNAKVVRSRDSRRLLRVQRSRVGIDRDAQKPVRALAPAASVARAMASEDDCSDPVTAAVVAAAAAFAVAKAELEDK